MVRVMREMADFIGADPWDLVFVPNATTGLNVAIQAAGLRPGDTMYMLNIGYGSVKKMAQAASASAAGKGAGTAAAVGEGEAPGGINVVYGEVKFPISTPQDIVDLVASSMPSDTRLAVFDSVTSNTALVLPVRQLIQLCKSRGVQVLIDGAHAVGQLHIDLRNGGCVRPLVVSHGSGSGFTSDFIWDGCRDYTPYLATSSALALWRALDPARVRRYCRGLLREAVALLTSRWGGRLLAPSLEMCGCMALVELPEGLAESDPATSTDAKYVQDLLHHVHSVECPVKCIQGRLYVRISVHIYNILDDYERLAEAVERIAASLAAGTVMEPQAGGLTVDETKAAQEAAAEDGRMQ
ncbi:hypothetical protein VOLCADRAFT_119903 [Volvox carteri f. nagariensis]|uniref:Aminotransferase class V domain-containing protein n=1 Tax=Volvox carteri f. nagariensis TaxID=3068 RepID=D8UHV9_VOLCA|nr:uncharacterized protein VOLCADRAFT_119903 [Volvox carteri f. nagariensis]EFJ40706.1 hypothetical protein VOLCADRAFT_119903 [Volvox carteri f. nagariensis]|eukprot:XP_002958252.1 hypothetical protein VOLCADRAFT_119903 [Volvox carteri f. nagariensis]